MKGLLFDHLHRGLGTVLDLRQKQHALTASNLANADTPGYRAKVIPFQRVLSEAVTDSRSLKVSHNRHISGLDSDPDNPRIDHIEAPPWAA
ncbi:MAG: flagellar basal body protein, partial [Myxococcota bacterium]|nr:flagellar basal body protein [Myxococcota bacterium]